MPENFIGEFIKLIANLIDFVGIFIVFAAVVLIPVRALFEGFDITKVRQRLALQMMFGLEFLIAADIIRVVIVSDIYELSRLALIVIVRIVLGLALKKEMLEKY